MLWFGLHFILLRREFGKLAVGVLNECFESDEKKTHALLMRRIDQCDGIMCLDIALRTNNFTVHITQSLSVLLQGSVDGKSRV